MTTATPLFATMYSVLPLSANASGPAIVPGKPEKSELYLRVTHADAELVMPPLHEKKPLSAAQKDVLKRWIAEGAKYEAHWAFSPPQKAPLPDAAIPLPVDAFVTARLKERMLALSPAAPSAVLCRRLYLDLIGLPPTPAELDLCSFWLGWELRLLRPDLVLVVGGLAIRRLLGLPRLTETIGQDFVPPKGDASRTITLKHGDDQLTIQTGDQSVSIPSAAKRPTHSPASPKKST